MSQIKYVDTDGDKSRLLPFRYFGLDNYPSGNDVGRVYVGTGSENIPLAKKAEVTALANNTVKLTGNQTIAGVKTFSSSPIVPTPTTDFQAATKKYVDNTAYSVEIIEDLITVPSGFNTVIVKDINRGGIFVSKTEAAIDPNTGSVYAVNGGTVFAKLGGGFWVRQFSGAINVKWFGVKGDGITDDTLFIQNALGVGSILDLDGLICKTSALSLSNNTIKNGTLKLNPSSTITTINSSFENVIIDANNSSVNGSAVRVLSGTFNFIDSKIININSTVSVNSQYAILMEIKNGITFNIQNSIFKDITNTDDGVPTNNGFCGGILFFGDSEDLSVYSTNKTSGVINACTFDNIYTQVGVGATIDNTDADAIRGYIDGWVESFDTLFNIVVSNCNFYNVQKSAIKNNGINGLTVNDCFISSKRTDFPMLVGVRIQTAYDCNINGLSVEGSFTYLFAISGKRIGIINTNISLDSSIVQGLFFQETGIISNNILVSGCQWNNTSRLVGTNYVLEDRCRQLTIRDIIVDGDESYPIFSLRGFNGVLLDNIKTISDTTDDIIHLQDTKNITISNCNFICSRSAITLVDNTLNEINLNINNCYMETTATGVGYRLINLRVESGTLNPSGIKISNTKLVRYSHTSATNDEYILIRGDNIMLNDLQLELKQKSTNTFAATQAINIISSNKVSINNITFTCNFTFNPSWAGWVVLLNNCSKLTVFNVHGGCRRGLELVNCSNGTYNNIVAVLAQTVVGSTGGTNITAGSDLYGVL